NRDNKALPVREEPRRASPRRPPTLPAPAPTEAAMSASESLEEAKLSRLLRSAHDDPGNFQLAEPLAAEIRSAAARLPESERKAIERCVSTNYVATDLAGLASCARPLLGKR